MDIAKLYNSALTNASVGKYKEAKKELIDILKEKTDNTEALLLLGKVEYYLKEFSSSRKCFETVLLYNPDNKAAYWGVKYYKERRIKYIIILLFLMIIALIISNSIVLYHTLNLSFRKEISTSEEKISDKIESIDKNIRKDFNKDLDKNTRTLIRRLQSIKREILKMNPPCSRAADPQSVNN